MARSKDNTRELLEMDSDPEAWRDGFATQSKADKVVETAAEVTLDNISGPLPGGQASLLEGDTAAEDGMTGDGPDPPGYFGESARIGRFAVLRQLGEGGMGVVYSAYDEELDRRVALKLLRPGRDNSPRNQARMQREARAMAKLSHPNVVQVYEVGRFEEQVFVAMEFVQGHTLGTWLKTRPRSWPEILGILVQAGRGLQAAHEAGVIHADFKPDNVLIDSEERVRVVDFGLSRRAEPTSGSLSGASRSHRIADAITTTGPQTVPRTPTATPTAPAKISTTPPAPAPAPQDLDDSGLPRDADARSNLRIAGTPAYMAPEQHRHAPPDQRSDQFSFSVTLYMALYGRHPFAGGSLLELIINLTDGTIQAPPANTDVPAALHTVLVRGLAHDPEQRWPSLADLLDALEAAAGRGPDPEFDLSVAKRQRIVLASIVAVSILGLSLVLILGTPNKNLLPTPEVNAIAGGIINTLLLAIIFGLRKSLLKNTINRRVTAWLIVSGVTMLFHRTLALFLAVDVATTMALDLLLLGSVATMAALTIERWIGWTAGLLLTSSVLAAALPAMSSIILPVAIVGVFCLAVLFWSR